jgi:hypothetical protein
MRVNYASSQISSPPDQPPSPLGKRSRKRIYTFLGIVAVVAVASTLIFVLLTVPNVGATITLEYNFTPGESLTYNATITQYSTGQNTSVTATIRMDVTGFDGENYTINETTISPIPFSTMTENVNKTGYCTFLSVGAMQSTYCRPIGSFFQKEEARVGETWQVPCYTGNAGYDFNGTLTYKFGAIQNITVPAGTYKVFKVDVSGSNLTLALMLSGSSFSENMTFNTQMYMEYGTCRLIESETQDSMSVALNNQSTPAVYNESLQMILIKQIK